MPSRRKRAWPLALASGIGLGALGGCGGRLLGSAPEDAADGLEDAAARLTAFDASGRAPGPDATLEAEDGEAGVLHARPDARARCDAHPSADAATALGLRDAAVAWSLTPLDQDASSGTGDPSAIGIADFNGDCHLDLAVAGQEVDSTDRSSVAILLGNGDGTFQPATTYLTGPDSYGLAIGDLNADGIPDLAVANVAAGVSILLGYGDGTFALSVQYAPNAEAYSVAIADVNGDGSPDVALGGVHGVVVLLANGDGTFGEPVTYPAGSEPYSVAIADFNRDGHPDLVAAQTGDQTVTVLLGSGDGAFHALTPTLASVGPATVTAGDLNGDGEPDLAVPGFAGMTTLLGSGDGTFHGRNLLTGGPSFQASTVVADMDRDGTMDLVTGNTELGEISIALGNGDGTFRTNDIMLGTAFYGVAVGDFNEDGWLDVAAPDLRGPLAVLLGGCGP